MLIRQHPTPCRAGVRAEVHEHRLAHRQARQVKGKRENRYVIKVMRFKQGRGWVPLLGSREPKDLPSLLIGQ
jgi:hypothetical protein